MIFPINLLEPNYVMRAKIWGQVYTPASLAKYMLSLHADTLVGKHIMEPSFGKGVFLVGIVERYITEFLRLYKNGRGLKNALETYIHGVEIDVENVFYTRELLDKTAEKYDIKNVQWDLLCADTLEVYPRYAQKMDFIIGNPPYVRVHNLSASHAVKNFAFARRGMTDLYLVFFEIAFTLLSPRGKLCYITPSSWLNSKAGAGLRHTIAHAQHLVRLVDLAHYQAFENFTTYTIISFFDNAQKATQLKINNYKKVHHASYHQRKNTKEKLCETQTINYADIFLHDKNKTIFLGSSAHKKILETPTTLKVKNGFATLCDSVFMGNFDFEKNVIPCVKASKSIKTSCIFPYDSNLQPLPLSRIREENFPLYTYFLKHKTRLQKRDIDNRENAWHLFGRTQALTDVYTKKIAFNNLLRDLSQLKIMEVGAGEGVYGGLYLAGDYDVQEIKNILLTQDFLDFVRALRKYKDSGYYTFSSGDLSAYLSSKIKTKTTQYERTFFTSLDKGI